MKTEIDRNATDQMGDSSLPASGPAWVLIRVPDLKPASIGAAVESFANDPVVENHSATSDEGISSPVEHEETADLPAEKKVWRNDTKHEPFRPEKFRSNVASKLVAGLLSMGAIALVYYALFGGSGAQTPPSDDWAEETIDENWTNDEGELKVDLGIEGEIGESSPIAPPFAAETDPGNDFPLNDSVVAPSAPQPLANEPMLATEEPTPPAPARSSLTDMLPWNDNQALAEEPSPTPAYRAEADPYQPETNEPALNAPLTQNAPTMGGYANEISTSPSEAPAYPTTTTPGPSYPTTGAGGEYQFPTNIQPSANTQRQADRRGLPWSNSPNGSQYPSTNQPAPRYSPAESYPSTGYPATNQPGFDTNALPREWRR